MVDFCQEKARNDGSSYVSACCYGYSGNPESSVSMVFIPNLTCLTLASNKDHNPWLPPLKHPNRHSLPCSTPPSPPPSFLSSPPPLPFILVCQQRVLLCSSELLHIWPRQANQRLLGAGGSQLRMRSASTDERVSGWNLTSQAREANPKARNDGTTISKLRLEWL